MYEEDRTLAEDCERLARETVAAAEWLKKYPQAAGRTLEGHEKELRKAGRLLRSCAVAARRKMCAGVFGPSQAGKSYLVSTLAGNAEGRLWTDLGGRACDFLSEINPAGGKESTGLVTRFTLSRPAEPPPAFPVHVRLLSPADLVKILANTYFSDAEHMETPDRAAMLASLEQLEERKGGAETGGMSRDDVEDLQEYIHKYFRGKARVQQLLDQHFWDRVIPLAPLLGDADRAGLFGIIWDGIPPFTSLLTSLFSALRGLNHATEAFCTASGLLPRECSIIDVATLGGLTPDPGDMLDLAAPDGKTASLPRVHVAALTAELIIPLRDKPADFFEHTDLLDFPGYRSRKMFVDLAKEAEDPSKLKECFLRGKVAYLFERYCAERELTSLLLCIGSGPQEVQGLGGAVSDWIAGTHGASPDLRADKETALFFILTKSDLEFEDKAGARNVSERWDTRMLASMELFTSHGWLDRWAGGKPFANFFLMRNPTVKLHLFDHDARNRETGLKEEFAPYVGQFAAAFMQSPLVNRHFAWKDASWKAFLTPNDGGLSLIKDRLAPICKPELKREQIRGTVREQLARLHGRLHPRWKKTNSKEEERKEKAALGQNLARVVLGMARSGRFGMFVRRLTVRDQDLYDLYFQAQHQIREQLAALPAGKTGRAPTPARGAVLAVDDMMADLLGEEALIPAAEPLPGETDPEARALARAGDEALAETLAGDEAQAFGEHIAKYWLAGIRSQAEDPVLQQYFSFSPELFSLFVNEIDKGFARLGVRAGLEDALRKASRYANMEKERQVWGQAGLAAGAVNAYVDWLGFDPRTMDDEQRTIPVGSKRRTLFAPPPDFDGLPVLEEDPSDSIGIMAMDWASALMHLIMENVNFDGDRNFDPEANSQLHAILEALALRN